MKKLLSFLAAGALALGLIGCSGDMHDELDPSSIKYGLLFGNNTILDTADICSDVNGWAGAALTKVDDTTYTYTFTAEKTEEQFSIREVAGSWTAGNRWCGALKKDNDNALKVKDGGSATLIYSDDPDPSHCYLVDLSIGTSYTLTFTIEDEDAKTISVALSSGGAAAVPVPYYLDGYALEGGFLSTGWTANINYLFKGASKDKDGNLTYSLNFDANSGDSYFAIVNLTDNSRYYKALTVGQDFVTLDETDNGMTSAQSSGIVAGKAYCIVVKTTPAKVVSAKIYEIAKITLSFKITNLDEGDSVWLNGNIWGSSWPQGWPILAWNDNDATKTAGYIADHAAAVADNTGVATFSNEWNTSLVCELGTTVNWEFKWVGIHESGDWDVKEDRFDCGDNLKFDYDVTTGGAKTLVINATTGEVTVE